MAYALPTLDFTKDSGGQPVGRENHDPQERKRVMFSLYFLIALSPFFKHLCWAQQKSFLIKEYFNLTLQGEKASISTADCLKHWKSAFLAMGKLSSKHWHGKEVFPQAQELMESGGFSPVFKCLMWSESCYSFPSERTKCPYHSASVYLHKLYKVLAFETFASPTSLD